MSKGHNSLYILTKLRNKKIMYVGIHSRDREQRLKEHYNKDNIYNDKGAMIKMLRSSTDDSIRIRSHNDIIMVDVLTGNKERIMLGEFYCYHLFLRSGIKLLNATTPTLPAHLNTRRDDLMEQIGKEPPLPINSETDADSIEPARIQIKRFLDRYTFEVMDVFAEMRSKLYPYTPETVAELEKIMRNVESKMV